MSPNAFVHELCHPGLAGAPTPPRGSHSSTSCTLIVFIDEFEFMPAMRGPAKLKVSTHFFRPGRAIEFRFSRINRLVHFTGAVAASEPHMFFFSTVLHFSAAWLMAVVA